MTDERRTRAPVRHLSVTDRVHGRKWSSRKRREWPDNLSWDDRVADRLNPIFARDMRRMMRAPATHVALLGSCMFLFLILQTSYGSSTSRDPSGEPTRWFRSTAFDAFHDIVGVLLAAMIVFVPLRAFFSMREEVVPGAAEQCLLSGIEPASAFRGKLAGAIVLGVSMLGIFAPALALFGATRIVGVGTVVMLAWLLLLGSIAAVSVAIAVAARCSNPALRTPLFAVVTIGFGLVAFRMYSTFPEWIDSLAGLVRTRPLSLLWMTLVPAALCVALASILGMAAFDVKDAERRVVPLRAWVLGVVTLGSLFAAWVGASSVEIGLWGAWLLVPFAFGAVLEKQGMSSVSQVRLPRSPWLRLVGTPLWPGRSRGFLFVCCAYGGLLVCTLPFLSRPQDVDALLAVVAWIVSGCAIVYAMRQRMSASRVSLVALGCVLVLLLTPWCFNAARGLALASRNSLEFCNPFLMVGRLREGGGVESPVAILGLACALACLFVLPSVLRNLATRDEDGA